MLLSSPVHTSDSTRRTPPDPYDDRRAQDKGKEHMTEEPGFTLQFSLSPSRRSDQSPHTGGLPVQTFGRLCGIGLTPTCAPTVPLWVGSPLTTPGLSGRVPRPQTDRVVDVPTRVHRDWESPRERPDPGRTVLVSPVQTVRDFVGVHCPRTRSKVKDLFLYPSYPV